MNLPLDGMFAAMREGGAAAVFVPVDALPSLDASLVSEAEKDRADRFARSADRDAFLTGRRLVRVVLSAWVDRPPESLPLETTGHGKPWCPLPDAPRFNLSHSAGWVAACFCLCEEVGIDLESLSRRVPARNVAERWFRGEERTRLAAPGGFFEAWTRKEAWVKATGRGFAEAAGEADTHALERAGTWRFARVQPVPDLLCHVVTRQAPARAWVWRAGGWEAREG